MSTVSSGIHDSCRLIFFFFFARTISQVRACLILPFYSSSIHSELISSCRAGVESLSKLRPLICEPYKIYINLSSSSSWLYFEHIDQWCAGHQLPWIGLWSQSLSLALLPPSKAPSIKCQSLNLEFLQSPMRVRCQPPSPGLLHSLATEQLLPSEYTMGITWNLRCMLTPLRREGLSLMGNPLGPSLAFLEKRSSLHLLLDIRSR